MTGTRDGVLAIWNANSGEMLDSFVLGSRIWSAEFSPNNQRLLIANGTHASLLDVATKEIIYRVNNPRTASLEYATFHPDGQWFATTGFQSALAFIWDTQSGELHDELSQRLGDFRHLAYSPDGKLLSAIDRFAPINPEIQYDLYVIDTHMEEFVFHKFSGDPVNSSAFSPDNRYFVFNIYDEIKIYDTTSWELICSLN